MVVLQKSALVARLHVCTGLGINMNMTPKTMDNTFETKADLALHCCYLIHILYIYINT